ncbi:MAG: COG4705 family protein [Armatimonadota bacterium]
MQTSQMRQMLNKVPEVTIYFWIIKVLCTTIGETAADYLNTTLHLGLTGTSLVMGLLLVVVLFFQFKAKKYIPSIYWLAVVLISVVGTLITDNLTDRLGVSLVTTTIGFTIALVLTFVVWYVYEKTLSVHTIVTTRREGFYWSTILFTFALGTAAGDLTAEKFGLGYLTSLLIFAGLIAMVTVAHLGVRKIASAESDHQHSNAVIAFWLTYILTRPLGASIGDYLSQARADGGLSLGTTTTSAIFLAMILVMVIYLTLTKRDVIRLEPIPVEAETYPDAAPIEMFSD